MFRKLYDQIKKILIRPKEVKDDLGLSININRDWKVVAALFVLFFCLVFILDYYLFYQIDVFGGKVGPASGGVISEFDMKKLDKVMQDWEGRVKEFNAQTDVVPKVIDPSL